MKTISCEKKWNWPISGIKKEKKQTINMKRRHFITLAGSSAAWISAAPSVGRDLFTTRELPEQELKNRSFAAFDRFREVWNFNDFWKRGNTFDACLTFA